MSMSHCAAAAAIIVANSVGCHCGHGVSPTQDGPDWGGQYILRKLPARGEAKGFGRMRRVDGGYRCKTITPDEVTDFCIGDVNPDIEWMTSGVGAKDAFCERECRCPPGRPWL